MLKAYKYCLLPTAEQGEQLARMFGSCRFVYNLGLETKVTAYRQYGIMLNCFELINQMVDLKKEATWLGDTPAQALQMSLRNLDSAYTAFFRGAGFPKFKNKRGRQSFQLPQGVRANFEERSVFLPKLKWVECALSRTFTGTVKTVTVSRNPSGKHFISFLIETRETKPEKKPVSHNTTVGVDRGIKTFAVLSDGQVFENHKFLRRSLKRLRVEQRTLSRRFRKDAAE